MIKPLLAAALLLAAATASAEPIDILDLPSDHVIVFGELHGVNEIPAFVADQVETLLKSGKTVRLGLEFASDDTKALNAAMLLQDENDLHDALMALPQWQNGTDARNGVAMVAMLQRLGDLTSKHPGQLTVFAYDIGFNQFTNANARDAHMAAIIGQHRELADDNDYLLVLAGNAHAFAVPGAPWNQDFRSMVVQLQPDHPVISLRNAQSGGEAWLCTPDCKIIPIAAMTEREIGIYLQPFSADWADSPVYHGIFFYGHATASKPLPVWLEEQRVR
jgi:hypothetical protein